MTLRQLFLTGLLSVSFIGAANAGALVGCSANYEGGSLHTVETQSPMNRVVCLYTGNKMHVISNVNSAAPASGFESNWFKNGQASALCGIGDGSSVTNPAKQCMAEAK